MTHNFSSDMTPIFFCPAVPPHGPLGGVWVNGCPVPSTLAVGCGRSLGLGEGRHTPCSRPPFPPTNWAPSLSPLACPQKAWPPLPSRAALGDALLPPVPPPTDKVINHLEKR